MDALDSVPSKISGLDSGDSAMEGAVDATGTLEVSEGWNGSDHAGSVTL